MDVHEPTEGFVVATDDPAHPGVTLFMVDRRKTRLSFWSFNLDNVFVLLTKEVADFHVSIMKYNNPRALTWEEAQAALIANAPHIEGRKNV
jgi:hypothetical protein